MPDEEVTLDYVLDRLVIHGDPSSVADQLLAFREETGPFGHLVYAGPGLDRLRARQELDDPLCRRGSSQAERRPWRPMMGASDAAMVSGFDGVAISYQVDGPENAPWLVLSNSLATDRRVWDPPDRHVVRITTCPSI